MSANDHAPYKRTTDRSTLAIRIGVWIAQNPQLETLVLIRDKKNSGPIIQRLVPEPESGSSLMVFRSKVSQMLVAKNDMNFMSIIELTYQWDRAESAEKGVLPRSSPKEIELESCTLAQFKARYS